MCDEHLTYAHTNNSAEYESKKHNCKTRQDTHICRYEETIHGESMTIKKIHTDILEHGNGKTKNKKTFGAITFGFTRRKQLLFIGIRPTL